MLYTRKKFQLNFQFRNFHDSFRLLNMFQEQIQVFGGSLAGNDKTFPWNCKVFFCVSTDLTESPLTIQLSNSFVFEGDEKFEPINLFKWIDKRTSEKGKTFARAETKLVASACVWRQTSSNPHEKLLIVKSEHKVDDSNSIWLEATRQTIHKIPFYYETAKGTLNFNQSNETQLWRVTKNSAAKFIARRRTESFLTYTN